VAILCWLAVAAIGAAAPLQPPQTASPRPPAAKPDCLVSDVANGTMPSASTLPIDARKSIFIDLQQAVARAQREAGAAYPTAEGGTVLGPGNVQKDTKLAAKRENMARALERSYVADLLAKRALTCAAARAIAREGRDAKWSTSAK